MDSSRSSVGSYSQRSHSGYSSISVLPPPISSPNKNCLSAAAKRYKFLKRMVKIKQMDFEFAMWQTVYLFVSPQKVFRDFQYRKQNKAQYARDDPAFLVLLLAWIVVSSAVFSSFLHYRIWQFVVFTLYTVIVGCVGFGMVVATGLWTLTNKFMRRKDCKHQDVEWAYAFDVHLNAFFPPLIILHVFQFFFYHLFYVRLRFSIHGWFLGLLLGNSIWVVALGYYLYITFLGYSSLPILENTRYMLTPFFGLLFLFVLSLALRWNWAEAFIDFYKFAV